MVKEKDEEFDFEAEAEKIYKRVSSKYDVVARKSQMKYDRNLSNLDKQCEELFNNEMEKIEYKISNRLKILNDKLSKFDEID
ncbi:hypothetical protein [uncultured Methanobrevibacter sp.]|uniref:hypothetical protein n=1 Tax=uncultured Methanobrevibacter sp. TaxID=253161 RepID=UPI0025FC27CF|nr:hypothetical protein [uncultured Methanobrevibacter sp.]